MVPPANVVPMTKTASGPAMCSANAALTAAEIRGVERIQDAGAVDVVRTGDGEAVYRRCSSGSHHHHLVCAGCGLLTPFYDPELDVAVLEFDSGEIPPLPFTPQGPDIREQLARHRTGGQRPQQRSRTGRPHATGKTG